MYVVHEIMFPVLGNPKVWENYINVQTTVENETQKDNEELTKTGVIYTNWEQIEDRGMNNKKKSNDITEEKPYKQQIRNFTKFQNK